MQYSSMPLSLTLLGAGPGQLPGFTLVGQPWQLVEGSVAGTSQRQGSAYGMDQQHHHKACFCPAHLLGYPTKPSTHRHGSGFSIIWSF